MRLANQMGFQVAFVNILNQLDEPFPYLQTNKFFTILERNIQVAIAGKRLSLLLGCLNKLNPLPTGIQESINASIVSAFPDAKHVYKDFRMNDCEKDYINKFVIPLSVGSSNKKRK